MLAAGEEEQQRQDDMQRKMEQQMQSRRLAAAGGGDEGLGRRVDDAGDSSFLVLSRNQADVLQTVSAKIKAKAERERAQGAHGRLRNHYDGVFASAFSGTLGGGTRAQGDGGTSTRPAGDGGTPAMSPVPTAAKLNSDADQQANLIGTAGAGDADTASQLAVKVAFHAASLFLSALQTTPSPLGVTVARRPAVS